MIKLLNRKLEAKMRRVLQTAIAEPTSIDIVALNAKKRAAEWIERNLVGSVLFSDRPRIQNYAAELASAIPGDVLELGVYKGVSIERFNAKFKELASEKQLFGIDSFRGLHDDWTNINHLNAFDQKGVAPKLNDADITLISGLVEDVLEDFLKSRDHVFSLIHFDMDLNLPTAFSLRKLESFLTPNTLLLFDNFHSYPGWENGEFKAFKNFIKDREFKFKAFGPYQCLIQIGPYQNAKQ